MGTGGACKLQMVTIATIISYLVSCSDHGASVYASRSCDVCDGAILKDIVSARVSQCIVSATYCSIGAAKSSWTVCTGTCHLLGSAQFEAVVMT